MNESDEEKKSSLITTDALLYTKYSQETTDKEELSALRLNNMILLG